MLLLLGIAYGVIVIHLHDDRRLAPVKVEGIERYSPWYLVTWGVAGAILGHLLPWVDKLWEETVGDHRNGTLTDAETEKRPKDLGKRSSEEEKPTRTASNDIVAGLTPVIRGMGAFFGIAFAIVS